jgi:C4-dicarboxylate-specific signal transduction histidine kinase
MAVLVDDLRRVPMLSDLSDEELQWLIDHGEELCFEAGDITVELGTKADRMFILLEGEIEGRTEDRVAFQAGAGDITGKLPHSRMVTFPLNVRAMTPLREIQIMESDFAEMLDRIPRLEVRLVRLMADRIREYTSAEVQQSKLAALGKLSAGLAHELNNPAAAAARAASSLRENLGCIRELDCRIASADLTPAQRAAIVTVEEKAIEHARGCTPLDALTRSDREDEFGTMLQKAGVEEAWELAPQLADAGFDRELLNHFAEQTGSAFREALARTALLIATDRLAGEIQESVGRISALVKSIKEYSYMDTAAEKDVDVHRDLENTLRILNSKINKAGVTVELDYDRDLPTICANGSELNQVWTNLIENAVDAMAEKPSGEKVLTIHTGKRLDRVIVEVRDTGPGVPDKLQHAIFEPFFTTKKQGQGTGLGLDVVRRIVRRHHGDLRLESEPGNTSFQVSLPIRRK